MVAEGGLTMLVLEVCSHCGWADYVGTEVVWSSWVG